MIWSVTTTSYSPAFPIIGKWSLACSDLRRGKSHLRWWRAAPIRLVPIELLYASAIHSHAPTIGACLTVRPTITASPVPEWYSGACHGSPPTWTSVHPLPERPTMGLSRGFPFRYY